MQNLCVAFVFLLLLAPSAAPAAVSSSTLNGVQVIIDRDEPAVPAAHAKPPVRKVVLRAQAAASRAYAAALPTVSPWAGVLLRVAMSYVGVPYVWGGSSPAGFDCSGYTWYAFSRLGIAIPRTADAQFYAGRPVYGNPSPGDLVFFQTYDYGPSHVGIYLGNGYFVNSIAGNVHVASFASYYFRSRYLGARRFLPG